MGWSSGVLILDEVAKALLGNITPSSEKIVKNALKTLIIALENQDCDSIDNSRYMQHPIMREILRELHPDWDCWRE